MKRIKSQNKNYLLFSHTSINRINTYEQISIQMSEEIEPHILKKYQILKTLRKKPGSLVWMSLDRKTRKIVTLNKIFDALKNFTDVQRTFRQILFLQELNGHENIVRLLDVIRAENEKDIYLVFDYMETDLHVVIQANILEEIHQQYIIYQILKSLKYMHSAELINCDLKPSNVMINSDCHVKVAGFELARSVHGTLKYTAPICFDYVAPRWYKAPEILLGSRKYTKSVDIWSVGCILGEMSTRKPMFPGSSTLNHLERILEVTGCPNKEDLDSMESSYAGVIIDSLKVIKTRNFKELFPNMSPECMDLMRRCLCFNPTKRLTIEQALRHPYLSQFHCEEEEIRCPNIIQIPLDDPKYTIKDYRECHYSTIRRKCKEQRQELHSPYYASKGK